MQFTSLAFLFLFLPVTLFIYYVLPGRFGNIVLLIASLFFYIWGEPIYIFLLLLTVGIDFTVAHWMEKWAEEPKKRKRIFLLGVVLNLGFLVIFKYLSLFISTLNGITGLHLPDPHLAMPLGISFYTFQSLSYLIGLYWKRFPAQKRLLTLSTYITAFPEISAGPIVRYETIFGELEKRRVDKKMFSEGVELFVIGLGKKALLADNIAGLWATIKAEDFHTLPAGFAWVGIVTFAFQIYFDFSGYSQMAIGVGRMLGFHFPDNFHDPYVSTSVSDFWRRWHITLGTWFREFVYIPLGGNRGGTLKTVRNLLVVWMLTGVWHGAQWNFMFWGLYFGLLLMGEKFLWGRFLEKWPKVLRIFYSFFFVCIGWVLFEFISVADMGSFLLALFGGGGQFWSGSATYYTRAYLLILIFCALLSTPIPRKLWGRFLEKWQVAGQVIYATLLVGIFLLSIAFLVNSTYTPFLYTQF